jgi:nicotinate-nucleotide adenylyltransferase
VPVKEHPFAKKMSSARHRLAMLKLIVDSRKVRIEEYELEKEGVSFSRDTLDFLSAKYSEHTFSWVIGSDNLPDFHKWVDGQGRGYRDLLAHYRFYVYPRKNFPLEPLHDNMVALTKLSKVAVSSTEVRERVRTNRPITQLVDPLVAEYIQAHRLYVE